MDSGKYDYEKLATLTALGRLKLLFGSFGTTFLFVSLVTLITIPVSLVMYYETSVNRLAVEKFSRRSNTKFRLQLQEHSKH